MAEEICPWALRSELELEYHDKAWGFPLHDDAMLLKCSFLKRCKLG